MWLILAICRSPRCAAVSAMLVRGIVRAQLSEWIVKNYGLLVRDLLPFDGAVRRWSDPRELAKVPDDVRLIEIASGNCNVPPNRFSQPYRWSRRRVGSGRAAQIPWAGNPPP